MNSKSQKLYSKMIAAAVATSAVVVPASALAQDVTVPVQAEDVTVKGDVITGGETQVDFYAASNDSATVTTSDTVTAQLKDGQVKVINNFTVEVSDLADKDSIKIYDSQGKGKTIGKATAKSGKATVKISKGFGTLNTIYVTNTVKGKEESAVKAIKIDPAAVNSTTPDETNIRVTNNVGKKDSVIVFGVKAKDVVKVYSKNDPKKENLIGTAKVKRAGSVQVSIRKGFNISTSEDFAYVSITNDKKRESALTKVKVDKEPQSATLDASRIEVKNAIGLKKDTVTVKDAKAKDVIKVYSKPETTKENLIGTAKTSKAGNVVVKIRKGFDDTTPPAEIYVTITNDGKAESVVTQKAVGKPGNSATLDSADIKLEAFNVLGTKKDTLKITGGLQAKDVIHVYQSTADVADTKKAIGTAKVSKGNEVVVKIKKGFQATGGNVYVTRTTDGLFPSTPVSVKVESEPIKDELEEKNVTFTNNAISQDILTVKGLTAKDVITVYDNKGKIGGTVLAKATAKGTELVIKFNKKVELTSGDVINVTVSSSTESESKELPITVKDPEKTTQPTAEDMKDIILNNLGESENAIVTVVNAKAKSVYKVYISENGKDTEIGNATAKKDGFLEIGLSKKFAELKDVKIGVQDYDKFESELVTITVKK